MRYMSSAIFACVVLGVSSAPSFAAVAVAKLNDTGIMLCRDGDGVDSAECTGTGEDGEFGRDVTVSDPVDGVGGFSFGKVCNNGKMGGAAGCATTATVGPAKIDWACTRDKRTALVWELKTSDGGPRDAALRYTNFGDGRVGDASAFVKAVNTMGLCGSKNWRLPSVVELQGIVDYGVAVPGPTLAAPWFPNAVGTLYWTSNGYAADPLSAWGVGLLGGYVGYHSRAVTAAVMLIRGTVGL